jgi:hypothetical protein
MYSNYIASKRPYPASPVTYGQAVTDTNVFPNGNFQNQEGTNPGFIFPPYQYYSLPPHSPYPIFQNPTPNFTPLQIGNVSPIQNQNNSVGNRNYSEHYSNNNNNNNLPSEKSPQKKFSKFSSYAAYSTRDNVNRLKEKTYSQSDIEKWEKEKNDHQNLLSSRNLHILLKSYQNIQFGRAHIHNFKRTAVDEVVRLFDENLRLKEQLQKEQLRNQEYIEDRVEKEKAFKEKLKIERKEKAFLEDRIECLELEISKSQSIRDNKNNNTTSPKSKNLQKKKKDLPNKIEINSGEEKLSNKKKSSLIYKPKVQANSFDKLVKKVEADLTPVEKEGLVYLTEKDLELEKQLQEKNNNLINISSSSIESSSSINTPSSNNVIAINPKAAKELKKLQILSGSNRNDSQVLGQREPRISTRSNSNSVNASKTNSINNSNDNSNNTSLETIPEANSGIVQKY